MIRQTVKEAAVRRDGKAADRRGRHAPAVIARAA